MPTILAFVAHPDDEAYSFAGTLALAARAGWTCIVCAATNGEGGERHDGGPAGPRNLASARQAELAASCAALGIAAPRFWGLPDGSLATLPGGGDRAERLIDDVQPQVVLSLGPDGAYGHPDHLALVRWVSEACARSPSSPALLFVAFPPGLFLLQYERCVASGIMGNPPLLLPAELGQPSADAIVDIRAVADLKLAAIAAHRTQLPDATPQSLFPHGIVDALLAEERFRLAASTAGGEHLAALFESLGAALRPVFGANETGA